MPGRSADATRWREIADPLVTLGPALPSIDIFIEEFNPLLLNIGRGLSEEFEFFRRGDNAILHFFVLVERGVVAIEVVSRTRLGEISEAALFRAPDGLDGVGYWTLALEAYAVS